MAEDAPASAPCHQPSMSLLMSPKRADAKAAESLDRLVTIKTHLRGEFDVSERFARIGQVQTTSLWVVPTVIASLLSRIFSRTADLVLNHNLVVIFAVLVSLGVCMYSFFDMQETVHEADELWNPTDMPGYQSRAKVKAAFPPSGRTEEIIFYNDGASILTKPFLFALLDLWETAAVRWRYDELCDRPADWAPCPQMSILGAWNHSRDAIARDTDLFSSVLAFTKTAPAAQALAIAVGRDLMTGDPIVLSTIEAWTYAPGLKSIVFDIETLIIEYVHETWPELNTGVLAEVMTASSFDRELQKVVAQDMILIILSIVLIIAFCAVVLGDLTLVGSRVLLGSAGAMIMMASYVIGVGLLILCGEKTTTVTPLIMFVLVGIGVDDVFIIVDSYLLNQNIIDLKQRMRKSLASAGPAITLTTLSDIGAFAVGSTATMPGVRSFTVAALVVLSVNFVLQITMFVICLHWDERRVIANRMDVLCWITLPHRYTSVQEVLCSKPTTDDAVAPGGAGDGDGQTDVTALTPHTRGAFTPAHAGAPLGATIVSPAGSTHSLQVLSMSSTLSPSLLVPTTSPVVVGLSKSMSRKGQSRRRISCMTGANISPQQFMVSPTNYSGSNANLSNSDSDHTSMRSSIVSIPHSSLVDPTTPAAAGLHTATPPATPQPVMNPLAGRAPQATTPTHKPHRCSSMPHTRGRTSSQGPLPAEASSDVKQQEGDAPRGDDAALDAVSVVSEVDVSPLAQLVRLERVDTGRAKSTPLATGGLPPQALGSVAVPPPGAGGGARVVDTIEDADAESDPLRDDGSAPPAGIPAAAVLKQRANAEDPPPILPFPPPQDDTASRGTMGTLVVPTAPDAGEETNDTSLTRTLINKYYAPAVTSPLGRWVIVAFFVAWAGLSASWYPKVGEGLGRDDTLPSGSYVSRFSQLQETYYQNVPMPLTVMLDEGVNYTDPGLLGELEDLQAAMVADEGITSMPIWLLDFEVWRAGVHGVNRSHEDAYALSFYDDLALFLDAYPSIIPLVVRADGTGEIVVARFIGAQRYMQKSRDRINDMKASRAVLAEWSANTTHPAHLSSPWHPFADANNVIRTSVLQALLFAVLAIFGVLLLFMPPLMAIFVTLTVALIDNALLGIMYIWGISFSAVSYIVIAMSVGLSVDYCAHIGIAFTNCRLNESKHLRSAGFRSASAYVREALHEIGASVLSGGFSTLLGVSALGFATSETFLLFFKLLFTSVLFGILHGFILLPAFLACLPQRLMPYLVLPPV